MKPIKFVIALMVFATALSAQASPLLNGLALEQQFNKDRYIAAVYSETLANSTEVVLDNNTPRSLEVRIVADSMSARRFRNQWMEGIAINNGGDTLTSQADNMVTFAKLFNGRLKKGDHLTVAFAANTGATTVALNGVTLGKIEDRKFFNTLLRAWVGPVPPSSEFRGGLLAAGNVDSSLLSRYEQLKPSGDRIAQVRAQVESLNAEQEDKTEVAAAKPAPAATKPKPTKPKLTADIPPPTLASIGDKPASAMKKVEAPKPSKPKPSKAALAREMEEDDEDEAPLTADLILARQIYHSSLLRHTFPYIRYPKRAQERGQEGSVRLKVTIDSKGDVTDIQTLQDSRYSSLNRAAVDAVKRAGPYPAAPPQLAKGNFNFTIPITFRLPD
ncbi:TonB family protein [Microbulbifer hainanensis]|uniref:TonB family protein n=1 Tax=Microbulbifer hainanensis TaxID=2735675 RepID=UPI0018693D38|nr:TonB family protein [Microbulbifer hainanensis]